MVDGIPEPESVTTWNFDGSYPVPMLNFCSSKRFLNVKIPETVSYAYAEFQRFPIKGMVNPILLPSPNPYTLNVCVVETAWTIMEEPLSVK